MGNGLATSGDQPLPEPMMTKFTDKYMCHPASMSYKVEVKM